MKTLAVAAARLRAAAGTMPGVVSEAEREGARVAAVVIGRRIDQVAPTGRLSGVGRNGAAVGVNARPLVSDVLVAATGPLHLVERDTQAHVVTARRAKALRTPWGPKRSVVVRGSKGRHPFGRGAEEAVPHVRAAMALAAARGIREALR